ncbi:GNAT family N-acetyltransferase [Undibacterium fentianense]|uniref:GNAT family N-acetyltransferase n=1 Tax=Undibacterium fentianense TaxID=2828728 RepID=A0A941IH67_9BURK|nr:GNAT family protein [Undibacterium fentianense]MBR7800685.1 GNAT family N-acetyltransferase [Undibacterium fentianense]
MPTQAFSQTFPIRRTGRFLLRQIQQSDRPQIFAGLSDPRVIAHYGIEYETEVATQEQIDWYRQMELSQTGCWWAICEDLNPNLIFGCCGIYEIDSFNQNADVGYWLLPKYWGLGIMHECLLSLQHFAFDELGLHRLEAEIEPANIASAKLVKKLGFHYEGRRRQVARRGSQWLDLDYYSKLAEDE